MKNPFRSLFAPGLALLLAAVPLARADLTSLPAIPGSALNNEALTGAIAVNPVTGRVYVLTSPTAGGGALYVFDGNNNNALIQRIAFKGATSGVAVNSRTNKIYVSDNYGADGGTDPSGAGTIAVVDGATNAVGPFIPVGTQPNRVVVDEVDNLVFTDISTDGTVAVVDGAANTRRALLPVAVDSAKQTGSIFGLTYDSLTRRLYVGSLQPGQFGYFDPGQFTVVDVATLKVILQRATPVGTNPVVVNPDPNNHFLYGFVNGQTGLFNFDLLVTSQPQAITMEDATSVDVVPATGHVFTASSVTSHLTLLDGKGGSNAPLAQVTLPTNPRNVAVNTATGRAYLPSLSNQTGYSIQVFQDSDGGSGGTGTDPNALTVPGTANVWLANAAPGTTASTGQDTLANAAPVRVTSVVIIPGATLTFSATGNVSNDPANPVTVGPDGGPYLGSIFYGHDPENGLAGYTGPINGLMGVFLNGDVPAGTPPAALSFNGSGTPADGVNYVSLAPALRQPFFIGDGKTVSGAPQTVTVPDGATRLFLGAFDQSDNENNLGSFAVTVTAGGASTGGATLAITDASFKSTSDGTGGTALPNDTLTYTFSIKNTGSAAANNVRLTDRLSGVKFKSADNGGALASGSTIDVVFPAFNLAAGASQTFNVKAKVPGTANVTDGITVGNIIYTVTADAPATGITSAKSVSQVSTVVSPYRLTSSFNTNPMAGDLITARFTFTNLATTTAAKTFALIHLPANANLNRALNLDASGNALPANGSIGQDTNRDLVFALGDVAPGQTYNFLVEVRVPVDVAPGSNVVFDNNRVVVGGATDSQINVTGGTVYGEPGITVQLSTVAPTVVPNLVLDKLIPDGTTLKTLFGFNPKLALQLQNSFLPLGYKIVKTDAAGNPLRDAFNNPVLDFDQIGALGAFLNPNVGQNGDDTDPAAPIYTVAAPSNKVPAPYATFTLLLSNLGGAKAVDVTIQDRIPAGFAFNPNGDNTSSHQDLVFINGAPADPSNFAFDNAGRSLLFNLPAAKVKDGKPILIVYQLNVLPVAQGGPTPGAVVDTKGAKYASASLSRTEIPAAGDGLPVLIVSPIHFYVESKKPTGKTAPINGNTKINVYYKNDGGQKTTDFRLVSTVPKGATFYRSVLLDANENERAANLAKGESVDNPAFGATTGQVVFHLGKLKPGQSGFVQVEYRVTTATLGTQLLTNHRAYVTNISYGGQLPVAADESGLRPVARAGGRPVAHDDNAPALGGASTGSITATRDPNLPRLTAGVAAPAAVREGQTFDYLLYVANPTAVPTQPQEIQFYFPPEVEIVGALSDNGFLNQSGGRQYVAFPTFAPGINQTVNPIPPHSAFLRKVTVRVKAGTAGATLRASAGTAGGFGFANMVNGLSIPQQVYNLPNFTSGTVSSMAIGPNDSFNLLGGAIATSTAADYGLSGSSLQKYALNLNPGTMNKTLGGTDAVSLNNGVVIVPLGAGNVLAIGTRSTVVAQGGGNLLNGNGVNVISNDGGSLIGNDGGGIVATGGGNLIGVANLIGNDGGGLIGNDGGGLRNGVNLSSLLAKLITQDGGGLIAQGGGNILRGGGGNLISDDGLGVVSNDGGSLRSLVTSGVVSNDGGSFAAGVSNVPSLITQDGGGLITQDGGGLVSGNSGSSLAAIRGGSILTAGGAAGIISDNSAGIRGTPDASFALHASGAGLVAVGPGN